MYQNIEHKKFFLDFLTVLICYWRAKI